MTYQEVVEILNERPEVLRLLKLFSELSEEQQKEALPILIRKLTREKQEEK